MTEDLRDKILCVDDDEAERRALAWVLKTAGLEVEEAASGGEGLRLAAHNPGLVVLDVNLPDIDGFEVCRRIKAHPATAAIPVLHLSGAFVEPDDVSRALAGGADGYLTKPVDPQALIAWTKALLRSRRAQRGDPTEEIPSPDARLAGEAKDSFDWRRVNGMPRAELEEEGEHRFSPVHHATGRQLFQGSGGEENGDAYLGIAVALAIEACLAVLVVLPLCGVAVPRWAMLLAVVPTLALLALCGWTSYRGRQ
jgi:DNA-binding response OmpR family regulator